MITPIKSDNAVEITNIVRSDLKEMVMGVPKFHRFESTMREYSWNPMN